MSHYVAVLILLVSLTISVGRASELRMFGTEKLQLGNLKLNCGNLSLCLSLSNGNLRPSTGEHRLETFSTIRNL